MQSKHFLHGNISIVYDLFMDLMSMKCVYFINSSATTITESCCLIVLGNLVIKSIEVTFHFKSGMGNGYSKIDGNGKWLDLYLFDLENKLT